MAPRKPKPVEPVEGHELDVRFVKERKRWEGKCKCGSWETFGPRPDTFEADHAIHLSHQRRPRSRPAA